MRTSAKVLSVMAKGLFIPACLILLLQAATSRVLTVGERDLALPGLHDVPLEMGGWKAAREEALENEISAYLKPDDYILRNYASGSDSINLFVAYFKSLQNVYGPHSPRVCLPSVGWLVRSSRIQTVQLPGRDEPTPVNEYVLEKSQDRILVVYWYQNNRNVWAEEFRAKLTLLPDLLRYRRSDASLVRVITPLRSADGAEEMENAMGFTRLVFPVLVERFRATE